MEFMPTLSKLIQRNREWAASMVEKDPAFFESLAKEQHPNYLWIGCSDSRIPSNQIMGLSPGEVFVHRNVANMVVHTDLNLLSVLQFAIDVLKVEHVILAGHYGCGGVKAAMSDEQFGLLDNWLQHIKDVEIHHGDELKDLDDDARFDRMCELNVLTQADNLRRTPIIQDAWKRGHHLEIHSWIYHLGDGHLRPLKDVISGNAMTRD
jgi:carbonic anhydrase